ncbi:EXS-domain-containing protein [Collybia nuda]|uniref:EXS-domain-containing protein n=1 Tax=Collybia nuda TaxID=64659 RepID=A0A9P5XWN8_9AGAR|nr:EXS-domain-containing protein [Collybia nuda]
MIDPFPILFKPSRYWLIRKVGKLLISGTHHVEASDFWLGDQFCSLVFTLSNLYLFGCVYASGLDETWRKCGSSNPRWYLAFLLASLPSFVRLVQSIRRYADSKLSTHLINGGKYGSGIVAFFFFYLWRHQGFGHGAIFVLWVVFNSMYSIYATSWDLIMDWSFLKIRSPYPLLRPELVYNNNVAFYYFAIVTNILIRFIWILYIPHHEPNIYLRTFIAGMLEMLRRWQWNFYRLENEHLGNMDQYRVTREVPLPYSFDDAGREDDNDDGDEDVLPRN